MHRPPIVLRPSRTHVALAALLGLLVTTVVATVAVQSPAAAATTPTCVTPGAADAAEPPCNPHLADSPWAGNHRSSYAQASSPFPGVEGPAEHVNVDHDGTPSLPVILSFSPAYPDGRRVIWASTSGGTREILKIDPDTVTVIDKYIPQFEEEGAEPGAFSVSGAYNLVDADNRLHVGQLTSLEVYGDLLPGVRGSSIDLLQRFQLPDEAMCGEDQLVGITMTYDGHVAFATENGVVGVVPRQPERMTEDNLVTLSLNGEDCSAGPDGAFETVSNSIAADENGGIYVVSSHGMYRIDWDGSRLTQAWRSTYAGAGQTGGGRLGAGSGSTPSLMGTAPDDDRFVVITDGRDLMHLVLLWRDEVPADWEPVRPGADPRIACEVPVTFGDEDATESLSEQSVLVRGHDAVVVNNLQRIDPVTGQLPTQLQPFAQLASGLPENAPTGIERFAWDPATRTCDVVWANPDVAIPNGIPTMSVASDRIYGIGARDGVWTLEGLDWETGQVELTVPTTASPTSNSFYAATTIGPDGTVWTGTFGGVTRFQPCDPDEESDCGRRLDPFEAVVGNVPTDPEAALRDNIGLPNDEPGDDPDATPGRGRSDDLAAAGPAVADRALASTGGGTALAGLTALVGAAALRRSRRSWSREGS